MPEIGRPTLPPNPSFAQATIAPKALSARTAIGGEKTDARKNEEIINRAAGVKPKSMYVEGKSHNQMGKDEFLKLLTFQLQNQDPMNPMEQGKMTGELAQFSQLEQLSNLNQKFDGMNKNQSLQDKYFAASFVGKKVVTAGSTLKLNDEGASAPVLFKLEGDASKVMVRILDEKNQTVGEIWKEGMSGGSHEVMWDGVTLDGQAAAKGNYKAYVKAWSADGLEIPAKTHATGTVTSVSFEEGEPVLTVDGQKVYLRDVSSFHTADNAAGAQNLPIAGSHQNPLRLNQAPSPNAQQAANAYSGTEKGIYD